MPRDRINCCAESWLPPKSTDYDVKWPCWYALARLKYFQIFDMIWDAALMESFVGLTDQWSFRGVVHTSGRSMAQFLISRCSIVGAYEEQSWSVARANRQHQPSIVQDRPSMKSVAGFMLFLVVWWLLD